MEKLGIARLISFSAKPTGKLPIPKQNKYLVLI